MNYVGRLPWPGCTAPGASKLLQQYPQFDLIVTGDNHKTFTATYEDRLLVNPGSLMRMDANQVDHKPCVFLWYAETNTVEQVFIPIESRVISREHIEERKERDQRIDSFISRLNDDWEAELSFQKNIEIYKQTNRTKRPVMDIVYKSLEKPKT